MAEKIWTQNQLHAIQAKNGALLVSAAAGSGKTAVLVERVIQRITDPVCPIDADKLLVVTFTRAAAAEMKERICLKLEELLRLDPQNAVLRRQQLLLAKANISTIHSFCSELIKENFYMLSISPDYRLADENELTLLKYEAVNAVLETLYENTTEEFQLFADSFSTAKSDFMLQQVLLRLYDFLCAHPFPEQWLLEKEKMYDPAIPVAQTQWGGVITQYAQDAIAFCKELTETSLQLFKQQPDLGEALWELLQRDADAVNTLLAGMRDGDWDQTRNLIYAFDFKARFVSAKGYKDNPVKLKIQANRDLLKKTLKGLTDIYSQNTQACRNDICALSPLVHQLFHAVRLFSAEYTRLKNEKNLADFNDLEHWTLQLLLKEEKDGFIFTKTAKAISARFAEVMVDEYQDANEIQDLIFRAVSGDGKNLFVVGDVKQSIYAFRQAMPQIFLRRKDSYQIYDVQRDSYPAKIILDKNFRSRSGVTEAVNFVFGRLMSPQVGDMRYTQEEMLTPGASYEADDTPDMAYHLLCSGAQEQDEDTLEALHIANLIKRYIHTYKVTDKGEKRAAKYSDFCILLRGASNHASIYANTLISCGVPALPQTGGSFLSAQEVAVLLAYLRVLDNPLQDVPLLTVLMSPLGGFTADDLAKMRAATPGGKLYFALKAYAQSGVSRAAVFLADTQAMRQTAAVTPTDILIQSIYTKTGYTAIVQAADNKDDKLGNLRLLQAYAKNHEQSGYKGLNAFIRFIDKLQERNCDLPANLGAAAETNAVKIMSIHHSKGLEFPFCFIAATARSFRSDKTDEVLLHAELGIGIKRKDLSNMCRYNTMPRQAVALALDRESKSEELRVLYVAMTRAREKLFIIGSQKNPQHYLQTMAAKLTDEDRIAPYIVRSANCILNWITQCALLHPSGNKLRQLAGMQPLTTTRANMPWEIDVIDSINPVCDIPPEKETPQKPAHPCDFKDVIRRITAKYPHSVRSTIPVKVAASALAHETVKDAYAFALRPSFLSKAAMTGAEKGTALHAFMQFADFKLFLKTPENALQNLITRGYITKEQAQVLDLQKITACLTGPVMQRYLQAEKTYREFRFTVKINAGLADKTLSPPYDSTEIILQGAVDCAFEEDGAIVIVDYKSDKVKSAEELRQTYKTQLSLYKTAMEQCTGLPVKECLLYSFFLNEEIPVSL